MESKAELLIRGFAAINRSTHLEDQSDAASVAGDNKKSLELMIQANEELDKAEEFQRKARETK